MTLVTDINTVWVSAVSGAVSPASKCVLQPPFYFFFIFIFFRKLSWGTSAWSKQAALCPSDYSKQICGHKYDTLSSRWFMKSILTAEFFCAARLCRRHLEGAAVHPANYWWQDGETCHSDLYDRWRKERAAKASNANKNTYTCSARTVGSTRHNKGLQHHRAALLTRKLCRENLFAAASEGRDLRNSWLIIYPAGFMALINFPPSLSLPSIESLKSTCIWCW